MLTQLLVRHLIKSCTIIGVTMLSARTMARRIANVKPVKPGGTPRLVSDKPKGGVEERRDTEPITKIMEVSPPETKTTEPTLPKTNRRAHLHPEEEEDDEPLEYPEYSENLVVRPPKGFLWGMGAQLADETKGYFVQEAKERKNPTLDSTIKFLTDYQLKDIDVIHLEHSVERGLPEINIIAVGESAGHLFRVARTFINEVRKLGTEDSLYAKIVGGRDDDYLMLLTREIAIHIVTVDSKDEHDVRGMLLDLPTYEEEKEHEEIYNQEVKKKKDKRRSKKWARKVAAAPDY